MARTSPLARWSTSIRRAWDSLRDFRTVRVVVRERAALLDGPREQEFLHWARDGSSCTGVSCLFPNGIALAGRTWANRWRGRSDARHVPVGDGDPPSPARIDASAPTA